MPTRLFLLLLLLVAPLHAQDTPWWKDDIAKQLELAKGNKAEIEKALASVPKDQRDGLAFLVRYMPEADLKKLKADFLLENTKLAYESRTTHPWAKAVPDDIFFNNVLPYANLDESRDPWRAEMVKLCQPLVTKCKTASEAVEVLNKEVFPLVKVKYSTQRKAPNQSPKESMDGGTASCSGLSILLSDACRAVSIPTRVVGTPMWANKRGNHTWLEIWDGDWHFTGACEPDKLDRGWFVGDAAQAKKDVPENAIYAASYKPTTTHFPLVWDLKSKSVHGENITDRYAKPAAIPADVVLVYVKVIDSNKKRVAKDVELVFPGLKGKLTGTSKGESADANDFLTFKVAAKRDCRVSVGDVSKDFNSGDGGTSQTVELVVK
jgi:Transglutaminase-like superfamily